jgi:hypothetical protein
MKNATFMPLKILIGYKISEGISLSRQKRGCSWFILARWICIPWPWHTNGRSKKTQDPENRQYKSEPSRAEEAMNNRILALLPYPAPRGFFGTKRLRPSIATVTKAPRKMNTDRTSGIARPPFVKEDPFPEFDPHKHVEIGYFVAMWVTHEDVLSGIPFFLEKVIRFRGKREEQGNMQVIWYWPEEKDGCRDQDGEFKNCYVHCMNSAWIPTNEEHD